MIFLWFIVAFFDMAVIVVMLILGNYDYIQQMMSDLLVFAGVPISGGVLSYFIKSAVENKEKIKGSQNGVFEDSDEEEDEN